MVGVTKGKCTITNAGSYDFPVKGTSLPYVVDFNNCQPENEVKAKITATAVNSTTAAHVALAS